MTKRHNPYDHPADTWLRGSFHGHSSEYSACASVPLAESVHRYSEVGAGFFFANGPRSRNGPQCDAISVSRTRVSRGV